MDPLAAIHLAAISFWLGVVSVEIIFERARLAKTEVIRLHKYTDRYVEIPTLVVVLATGILLWARTDWSISYLPKVLAGLGAVGANVFCYYLVESRTDDRQVFRHHSVWMYRATIFGLACFVIAVALGGRYAGWW